MATTVSLKPNAVEISGSTSGTTTLQATAVAGTTTLTLPAATDTLVGKATTDTLTNKTLTGAAMNGTLGATTPSTVAATTLTTSSTVTHNGGTANGVPYLDGSKVLTTGSALVFDGTNLLVGTTSAISKLTVQGSSDVRATVNESSASVRVDTLAQSGGQGGIGTQSNHRFFFMTNGTERATIDTSGNLLVGRTTTANTTVGSGLYADGLIASCQSASTNGNTAYDLYSTGAAAYRFYVGMGGTVFATSTVITAISDERLKENVRDIDTGLDSIMALKPRRFDWKEGKGQDKKDVAGFIAQEFENVFPECVSTSKAGEDGIEYKNINHETLIPTLVKAIQELKAEIDSLKSQLNGA